VLDFACGSGSLLLNVRNRVVKAGGSVGMIYGQEKNITTYNLCRMNMLLHPEHIKKIVDTYQHRKEEELYSRRVTMEEIIDNDYNLNISRYVSTAKPEPQIDLSATHKQLVKIEQEIRESTAKHNAFLKELGLSPLPTQATENRE